MESKRELQDLIEGLVEGDLSPDEHQRLTTLLKSDRDARQLYLGHMKIHGMLQWELRKVKGEDEDVAPPIPYPVASQKPVLKWMIAAAAVLFVSLSALIVVKSDKPETNVAVTEPVTTELNSRLAVARITFMEDVVGLTTPGLEAVTTGSRLGDRLLEGAVAFDSGVLQITFDSGVTTVLEGPATFRLDSQNRGFLKYGKLTARVPKEAVGFIVNTPSHVVKDMGTAFAVEVDKNGNGALHVREGWVTVSSKGDQGGVRDMPVRASEAVRFWEGDQEPVAAIPAVLSAFVWETGDETFLDDFQHLHLSFNEGRGSSLSDVGGSFVGGPYSGNALGEPEWIEGVFDKALRFDGVDDYVDTNFPGVTEESTIAFWLKLSPDADREDAYAMLSWGRKLEEGKKWAVMWNAKKSHGALGAVKISFEGTYLVGETDLRDGLWHHVAVVYNRDRGLPFESRLLFYVDGKLEQVSGFRSGVSLAKTAGSLGSVKLQIGRFMDKKNHFAGALDELHVFNVALSPGQIMTLKTENRIPEL